MFDDLHDVIKYSLGKCLDLFPDGSALYNNTRSALRNVNDITDDTGTMFVSRRMKRGIDTILSESLRCLEDSDSHIFLYNEIHQLRSHIEAAPVSK